MDINYIDLFFGVLILIAIIRCMVRGFVAEFHSMAALVVGILLAVFLSGPVSLLLVRFLGENFWNRILAVLILFILGYLIIKLMEKSIQDLIDKMDLEKLDRVLGFFLGLIEGLLAVALLLLLINGLSAFSFISNLKLLDGSFFGKYYLPLLTPLVSGIVSPNV